ncbi:MAG: DUF1963 domain-containing protein [Bacteroidales bacterium]|nr:DUF1963 domain-containing protein [Bacteroidales bacterium]
MAIRLTLNKTERILFCGSKWWGDPDMPENMQYPVMQVTEDGETYDYPLTFVCQINCEDIAKYDKEGKLPHEGMLYFFAAVDDYIGYESPVENPMGEWPKGRFVVKYAKTINFETFQTCMLVGDEDEQLTEPELEITFSECENDEACIKMLAEVAGQPDHISLLQLNSDAQGGIDMQNRTVNLIIKESDLGFGNWKRAKAVMTQSEK